MGAKKQKNKVAGHFCSCPSLLPLGGTTTTTTTTATATTTTTFFLCVCVSAMMNRDTPPVSFF